MVIQYVVVSVANCTTTKQKLTVRLTERHYI